MSLAAGETAPSFDLPKAGGGTVSSAALHGRPYVLYFYPKADTSGCTKEAQAFQASLGAFATKDTTVIGVSRDAVTALDKFAAKFGLTFPLACDERGALTEAYGVWIEKSMYGRKYMGIERATFLVGADGVIRKTWPKVKIEGHAADVLASL